METITELWERFERGAGHNIDRLGEFESLRRWVIAELGVTHEDSHKVARKIFKERKRNFKEKRKCLNGSKN